MSNVNNRTGKLIACCGLRFVIDDNIKILQHFKRLSGFTVQGNV